jgi:hypothetical protein
MALQVVLRGSVRCGGAGLETTLETTGGGPLGAVPSKWRIVPDRRLPAAAAANSYGYRRTMVGRLLPLLPSLVRREATGRYRREGSSASEAARDRGAPRTGVPCCSVAGEAEAHKEPVARALHRTASGVLGQAPSYAWRWQASMSFLSAFRTPESLSTNSALKAKTSRRPSTAFWHI